MSRMNAVSDKVGNVGQLLVSVCCVRHIANSSVQAPSDFPSPAQCTVEGLDWTRSPDPAQCTVEGMDWTRSCAMSLWSMNLNCVQWEPVPPEEMYSS